MSSKLSGRIRLCVKLAFLLAFLLFSLSGILPGWLDSLGRGHASPDAFAPPKELAPGFLKGILPALSPFVVFSSALAQRSLCVVMALLLAFGAVALALWRGRLFCAWICPFGTLMELEAKILPKGWLKTMPRVNGALFYACLIGAALGLPVFLAFDPLSSFSRLALGLHWPFPLVVAIPASLVLFALLLGFLKPLAWCSSVCPLGYALGLAQRGRLFLARLGSAERKDDGLVSEVRRDVVKGLCAGIPLSVASEAVMASSLTEKALPVLPPGAVNSVDFHANCTRCYACVAACPSKVLTVTSPNDLDMPSWFAPHLVADKAACLEDCNRCSQVCAPGAIRPVSKVEKHGLQIGIAKINHASCLAWGKGEHCMVCDEYCPYGAIANEPDQNGIPRPVVKKSKCRGCGFCQMACPSRGKTGAGPAIRVVGVLNQKRVDI